MPGAIRTKEKCPKCGKGFSLFSRAGMICKKCKTTPQKFFIDLPWKGRRAKLYSDKSGRALDSYSYAQEVLTVIHNEVRNKTFDPSRYFRAELVRFHFENIAQLWLEDKKRDAAQGLRALSYIRELEAYNTRYFGFFRGRDIREIRRIDIDEFSKSLPDHLSPKTIKNIFIALKNLFHEAHRKEIVERVPSFPTISVPEYTGWKWIPAETQIAILQAIPEQDRPIFAFLFLHGCRIGEVRALKVKDIELQTGTIRIRRAWDMDKLRESTKQKRQNVIPIHPEVRGYIEEVCKSCLPEAFLFVNKRTGKPYGDDSLRKTWARALKAAKAEHVCLKDASRHSYASQLVNSNVPLNIISRLLGHSSLKMTQRYAHENLPSLMAASSKLTLAEVVPITKKEGLGTT